jgi:hypothetical protein
VLGKFLELVLNSNFIRRAKARPSGAAPQEALLIRQSALEVKLQRELHQARITNVQYLAEGGVAHIAVHASKLRVVPDVEYIAPELHAQSLA